MNREEVIAMCQKLHDSGRVNIRFSRIDGCWEEHDFVAEREDHFVIFGTLNHYLYMYVDDKSFERSYSSFKEAIEATDQFMRDFEED
jgi:hypothetical protein